MAAPHVSGAAALLISSGVTDPDMISEVLETTAKDLGPAGWDEAYGWGLIDVGAALHLAARFEDDEIVILDDRATPAEELP
jgi:serine protease